MKEEETSSHAGLVWYSWLHAGPKAKPGPLFSLPKSISRGPLGCPRQPSGLKSRGSGCPLGSPTPYAQEPGTKLIVLPSPSLPRSSSSCLLSSSCTFHLIWPAATQMSGHLGKAAVGLQREPPRWAQTGPSMHCPASFLTLYLMEIKQSPV